MYVRITWFDVPTDQLEGRIADYPTRMQSIREAPGCMGIGALANRETGAGVSVSYWETKESMLASDAISDKLRTQLIAEGGIQLRDLDRFEFLIQERVAPPSAGTFARVVDSVVPTANVDAIADLLRTRVGDARALPGFQALLVMANRDTGRLLITSIWNSAAYREASNEALQGARDEVRALSGGANVKVDLFEVAYLDIKLPTPA
jgi:heme-degrading monooxygenase HmoA